jgi:hypothetical protein
MIRDERVAFAVRGIDLADFFQPGIGGAVGERFDGRVDRHRVKRLGRNFQRSVRFVEGFCFVGVLEQQVGHQFVRFIQFRIEFDRLARIFDRLAVKTVRADEREAVVSLGVFRIALQRFAKKIVGLRVVEPLMHQAAPAHANHRVRGRPVRRDAKLVVRVLIHFHAPEAFGAEIRIARGGQRFIALLRFGAMAVLAQSVAVFGRRAPREARAGKTHRAHGGARKNPRGAMRDVPVHLSRSPCTRASSSSAAESWLL